MGLIMGIIIEHSPVVVAKHISGKLATIDQVVKGLECDCFCPECGAQLIAKKGEKLQHHFSHKSHEAEDVNFNTCSYDFWRSLHLLCFKALKEAGSFRMPAISAGHREMFLDDVYEEQTILVPGREVKFDSIEYCKIYDGQQLNTIIAKVEDLTFLICPLFSKEKDSSFETYQHIARKGKGEIPVLLIDMESIKEKFYPHDINKFSHYVVNAADRHWSTHGAKVTKLQSKIIEAVKKRVDADKLHYISVLRELELKIRMEDTTIYDRNISKDWYDPPNKVSFLKFSDFDEIETENGRHLLFRKKEDNFSIYITLSTDKINPPKVYAKSSDICIWMMIPDAWRLSGQIGTNKEIKYKYYKTET